MLTAVLKRSLDFSKNQIEKINNYAECYEIRLDTFSDLQFEEIKTLTKLIDKPFILTLRKESQGGWFSNDIEKQLSVMRQYLTLKPSYIDLAYDTPHEEIAKLKEEFPEVKLISSFHDFRQSPQDLEKMFKHIYRYPADIYKMVTMPSSALDSIAMLKFSKKMNESGKPFIGICLGEIGEITRILGPVFGNVIGYASSDDEEKVAPGQISCKDLCEIYNYKDLNTSTKIYALIGNPVKQSISHLSHNKIFKEFNLPGVYIKISLEEEDVKPFLDLLKDTPFEGLSVTVPFKEHIFKSIYYPDKISKKIKAVNTLKKENNQWHATNTDAKGALEALEEVGSVKGKVIVVLGAGGVSKAITYEAISRDARVRVISRTFENAKAISKDFGCEAYDYRKLEEAFSEKYHILVNATTVGMENPNVSPISKTYLEPNAVVMDATFKTKDTKLIKDAKEIGCKIVYGYKMFAYQAIGQFEYWLDRSFEKQRLLNIIEQSYNEYIENS